MRCLASGTYVVRALLILGVTLYTPAVALNTVVGVPYWASLLLITVTTITFNLLGGLKAAIKADVIQGVTMILIMIAIVIQSMVNVWSVEKIVTIPAEEGTLRRIDKLLLLINNFISFNRTPYILGLHWRLHGSS